MISFNIQSPNHLSFLFFGGSVLEEVRLENGNTKAGKLKYKNVKVQRDIKGLGLFPLPEWKNKKGLYATNEGVLKILSSPNYEASNNNEIGSKIVALLLEIRRLNKLISTYYKGILESIYDTDNCIHANFSHVFTPTGRLNCSKPNIQNQSKPPELVTKHFTSRFGKEGILIAADYAQIDVRAEAEQCQDPNYIKDILNKVDTHTKNLALKERVSYEEACSKVEQGEWKEYRSKAKGFTFAQQYLAGVKTTVKASGMSEDEVKALIEARKEEFPKLYEWHKKNKEEIERTGQLKSITGRIYKFNKYPSPKWLVDRGGPREQYSINDMSNYPTQGLATGDIALIMIGKFWREKALHNRVYKICDNIMCKGQGFFDNGHGRIDCFGCKGKGYKVEASYLMINTVHDNLILDSRFENSEQAKKDLNILTDWVNVCYTNFKYIWVVPIEISVSIGESWFDCF